MKALIATFAFVSIVASYAKASTLDCSSLRLTGVYQETVDGQFGPSTTTFELLFKSLNPLIYDKIPVKFVDGGYLPDRTQMPGFIDFGHGTMSCSVEEQYGITGSFRYLHLKSVAQEGTITLAYKDFYGYDTNNIVIWKLLLN